MEDEIHGSRKREDVKRLGTRRREDGRRPQCREGINRISARTRAICEEIGRGSRDNGIVLPLERRKIGTIADEQW